MPSFFSPRGYTFRGKLLLAFLLMNAVLIPFSVSTRIAHTREMVFKRELNAINNIGHLVANEVANDLIIHDENALVEELQLSVQQTHIVFVSVLDTQGIAIYSTDSSMAGRRTRYANSKSIKDEKERLFITDFPLLKYRGSVQIGYSLDGVRADLKKAFQWSVGLGGAMLLLTLWIAWWMSGFLARPLNLMIAVAGRYATGDFTARVPVTSHDNIGELASTLNDMAAQLRDLTDNMQEKIREKTRQLEESNKKLMELDKLKSDFVAMVSHELRTPLTSIIGFAKTMQSLRLTVEQQRDYLRIIETEGKRLAELIEEYLDISKIESGNFALKMAPFDFHELVKETTDSLNVLYTGRILSRMVGPVFQIIGDRNILKRVLINIIDNACKYSPAGSPVTVTVRTRADRIVVSVEDSGPGIPAEDRERIFEKFYRGKNGATGRTRGTGLGLAISKGLLEAHGGTIQLTNDRNPGTTVIIEVPVAGTVT
jgi:signal transduction histidine kinase